MLSIHLYYKATVQSMVSQLSQQCRDNLAKEFSSGFEEKNVRRMMQFAAEYQDFEIVATLL